MKRVLLLLCVISGILRVSAQDAFLKVYGTNFCDAPVAVDTTDQGGYVMGGHTTAHDAQSNLVLITTDANGDTIWSREYDSGTGEYMSDMMQTADGGYIMVAERYDFSAFYNAGVFVVKTDANGNVMWSTECQTQNPSHAYPEEVIQTADGGYAVAGYVDSMGYRDHGFLFKVNSSGALQWMNTYRSSHVNASQFNCITEAPNGDLLMAGIAGSPVYPLTWMVRTDANGNAIWGHEVSSPRYYYPKEIVCGPGGSIYVSGNRDYYSAVQQQIYLSEYDTNGNCLWIKSYAMPQLLALNTGLLVLPSGELLLSGYFLSSQPQRAITFYTSALGIPASGATTYPLQTYNYWFTDVAFGYDSSLVLLGGVDHAFTQADTASFFLVKGYLHGNLCTSTVVSIDTNNAVFMDTTYTVLVTPDAADTARSFSSIVYSPMYYTSCFLAGIEENSEEQLIHVYPDPAQDYFIVEIPPADHRTIVLYDMSGQCVRSQPVSGTTRIFLEGLAAGMYFYRITGEQGVYSGKLIKE